MTIERVFERSPVMRVRLNHGTAENAKRIVSDALSLPLANGRGQWDCRTAAAGMQANGESNLRINHTNTMINFEID